MLSKCVSVCDCLALPVQDTHWFLKLLSDALTMNLIEPSKRLRCDPKAAKSITEGGEAPAPLFIAYGWFSKLNADEPWSMKFIECLGGTGGG